MQLSFVLKHNLESSLNSLSINVVYPSMYYSNQVHTGMSTYLNPLHLSLLSRVTTPHTNNKKRPSQHYLYPRRLSKLLSLPCPLPIPQPLLIPEDLAPATSRPALASHSQEMWPSLVPPSCLRRRRADTPMTNVGEFPSNKTFVSNQANFNTRVDT